MRHVQDIDHKNWVQDVRTTSVHGVRLELISNASRSDSSFIWTLSGQRFPLPIKTQCAESWANMFTDLLILLLAPHW